MILHVMIVSLHTLLVHIKFCFCFKTYRSKVKLKQNIIMKKQNSDLFFKSRLITFLYENSNYRKSPNENRSSIERRLNS